MKDKNDTDMNWPEQIRFIEGDTCPECRNGFLYQCLGQKNILECNNCGVLYSIGSNL
jgi:uncharacterized protein (DUF983 family)